MSPLSHPEATPPTTEITNEKIILQDRSPFTPFASCMVSEENSEPRPRTETLGGLVTPVGFAHETHEATFDSITPPNSLDSPTQSELAALPQSARDDLRLTLLAFAAVAREQRNGRPVARELRRQALNLRLSFNRLRNKWFAYKKSGDWRTLLNKAKAGPNYYQCSRNLQVASTGQHAVTSLTPEFIQFWRTLCEENQRTGGDKAAWHELRHIYRTGQTTSGKKRQIPGYPLITDHLPTTSPTSPTNPHTGLSHGWSYANLTRHSPDKFAKTAAKIGRAAAAQYRRMVLTTRVGLQVGQYYLFDDQEYDLKVNFLNATGEGAQKKALRPLGLNALDLYSACSFAYAFKPTLAEPDGTKKKLREIDMMWFVVDILSRFGFNPITGTHLVVEHGTAAIRPDFEQRITLACGGKVIIDRGGIGGAPSYDALFEGAAKGNPRFKAPLESFFNLVRNRFATLPGQVGKDRDHSPEELHGRDRYNSTLLRAMDALPPDRAALLIHPFLSWHQFLDLAPRLYQLINNRTDHNLEGWAKAGLIGNEWRITTEAPWMPMREFLKLPVPQQMSLTELFNSPQGESLTRTRKLSPNEVWTTGATQLQSVSNALLPDLIGLAHAYQQRSFRQDGYLYLHDRELDPDPIIYHQSSLTRGAGLRPASSRDVPVAAPAALATHFNLYLNPFDPRRTAILTDDQNRYLGELTPQDRPCRADLDAIHREMGAAKADEAKLLAPLAARHAEAAREKTRMHNHNAAVLQGRPITAEQRDRHDQLNDNKDQFGPAAAEDILAPESAAPISHQTTNIDDIDDIL